MTPGGFRRGVRLGVDVGSVRVGLAVCDPDGLIASAVRTVPRDEAGGADRRDIADEARERDVVEVVVGHPLSLDGREGPAARLARGYAEALAREVAPVPVRLVDERLSTVSATRALRGAGVPGRRQRAVVDQVAAVVLLQQAVDVERTSGRPPGEVVAAGPDGPAGPDAPGTPAGTTGPTSAPREDRG